MFMMREDGIEIGRFKVRKLMSEMKLVSKQPGSHAYKKATVERPDIPNVLGREFTIERPNKVWCGDITYIWAQGHWHSRKPIRQPELSSAAVALSLHAKHESAWKLLTTTHQWNGCFTA